MSHNRHADKPELRRGDLIKDARYGETEIIHVTDKTVWYKNKQGTYKTSRERALRMLECGTAFPPLKHNDTRRWRLPYV